MSKYPAVGSVRVYVSRLFCPFTMEVAHIDGNDTTSTNTRISRKAVERFSRVHLFEKEEGVGDELLVG